MNKPCVDRPPPPTSLVPMLCMGTRLNHLLGISSGCFKTIILGLSIVCGGCDDELGPERFETTRVVGRVHMADRPVSRGWLEFAPVDGTRGNLRSARLRPDGTFTAEKVPVGRCALKLVDAGLRPSGDPGLDRFLFIVEQVAAMRRTIAPGGPPLEIDLRAEALELGRSRGAR